MTALLQQQLNLQLPLPLQHEVLNAGVVGSDAFFGYHLLKDKLLLLQPEIVLLNVNYSDFTNYIFCRGFERFKNDSIVQYQPAPAIKQYYKHSHLLRAFINFCFGL